MPNYGVVTQICVLQEFREKKLKSKKKQQMGLKMRAATNLAKAKKKRRASGRENEKLSRHK